MPHLFSDAALKQFESFAAEVNRTSRSPSDHQGGFDSAPRFRPRIARDDVAASDPSTVAEVFRILAESFPEEISAKILTVLEENFPGSALGDLPAEPEIAGDDEDDFSPAGQFNNSQLQPKNIGGPAPFKGMPQPGGKLASDSYAKRFPSHIVSEAVPRRRPAIAMDADDADYLSRFPQAAHISWR
jgi:hypothetical protein